MSWRLAGAWLVCVAAALTPTPDHLGGCVVMYESRAYAHGLALSHACRVDLLAITEVRCK